ncbi:hypothetical protein B0I35DRAFT_190523 [Stachybotrys elegans]|uniref:Uncharacterized protein n=1 Tax=Stachybotrys elegans TaxID=80388 RepID=A0A8K0WT65_9HYPO|nr:hypothetical protein B0I35DRAFT_190523 [Stachybotrys elegans]
MLLLGWTATATLLACISAAQGATAFALANAPTPSRCSSAISTISHIRRGTRRQIDVIDDAFAESIMDELEEVANSPEQTDEGQDEDELEWPEPTGCTTTITITPSCVADPTLHIYPSIQTAFIPINCEDCIDVMVLTEPLINCVAPTMEATVEEVNPSTTYIPVCFFATAALVH